jgi:DNA-binding GntR family transcriptional regulator
MWQGASGGKSKIQNIQIILPRYLEHFSTRYSLLATRYLLCILYTCAINKLKSFIFQEFKLNPMIAIQRSQSLRQQVYQALRQIILRGDLASGERIIETKLAEQLQVSRTPIREAIGQLQREKLIVSNPKGGLRVATLSIEDAIQLYDCRIALEQLSAAGACQLVTPQQLKQLEKYVLLAESAKSQINQANSWQLLEIDYQFHHLIAESSGNQWLLTLLEQVFDKMALLRVQTTKHNPQVLEIRLEHRQIFEAIASRDSELAQKTIQDHLIASKYRVVRELEIINHNHKSLTS